tara:strand:- start:10660 stop:11652 length:993 start_codon:yes stop_codon:yes gene_type:complete
MNIFVTGSEGFIGSHLVEKLIVKGHKVKALVLYNDHNRYGWLDNIDSKIKNEIEFVLGDIRDLDFINNQTKKIDTIFHLAALIGIPYSYLSPFSYLKTNIEGSMNIFKASLNNNVNQLIHTSTSEVYGSAKYIPIDEAHPLNAQSPYAASKLAADQMANSFYASYNLPVTTIRPFNTYGPRQSARAVISTIILQAINGKKINLGETSSTRDFTYISDTVDAFIKTINNKKTIGETINLGTGYEITIKELVSMIGDLMGRKLIISHDKRRLRPKKSEVNRLLSKNIKAKKLLKWAPKLDKQKGLKKGLKLTIEWFEQNINKINFKSKIYNQ